MRILVCGGRDYNEEKTVNFILDSLKDVEVVIDGGAKGADTLASKWAIINGIPSVTYCADWTTHGKAAGFIRNKLMLDNGKPDLVIAFPGGKGTANMVELATKANIPVVSVCAAKA